MPDVTVCRFPHRALLAWQPPAHTVIVVTGPRGQGKSTLIREYAANIVRIGLWDPKGEYAEVLGGGRMTADEWLAEAPFRKSGMLRVSVGDPLGDEPPDPDRFAEDFERYARGCWMAGNLMMGVSEVTTTGASASYCPPTLAMAINIGRDTRGISVLVDAQRAEMVPTVVRSQASEWFAFRSTRVQDVKALEETFRGGEIGTLRRHEFVHWTPDGGPLRKTLAL